jgi:polygalacturonase
MAALFHVLILLLILNCCSLRTEPARQFIVTNYGAVGDGETLNTDSIQRTINAAAGAGGGTVVIPEGTFLSGAIFLKPGVHLQFENNAVLKGSTDIRDYPKMKTRIEGALKEWVPALINADNADHLRITGGGTLDGNGAPFWKEFWDRRRADPKTTNLDVPRPRLMLIQNSKHVLISGIHFTNSGFWNLHLYRCVHARVENATFEAPNHQPPDRAPSSDGIDIDSCQRVTVSGCTFGVGDDCVCLKGSKGPFAMGDKDSPPTEHIHVTKCIFKTGHGVVTLGSEATVIRDVAVEDCQVLDNVPLVRIKVRPDTPQHFEDIRFRNITLSGDGSIFDVRPWTQFFDLQGQPLPRSVVRGITVSDVHGSFGAFGEILGKPETRMADVTLKNINVTLKNPKLKVRDVKNLRVENVTVNGRSFSPETDR